MPKTEVIVVFTNLLNFPRSASVEGALIYPAKSQTTRSPAETLPQSIRISALSRSYWFYLLNIKNKNSQNVVCKSITCGGLLNTNSWASVSQFAIQTENLYY